MADLMVLVAHDRDRRAFAELYAWFAPRVKGFLIRRGLDAQRAEEVAQEAMLTVWRKADRFDRRQASVATWIFTIARNRSIDELRREKRPEIELDDPTLVGDGLAQPAETAYAAGQEAERLKAAIGTLPEEQARLLHMAFFEDKSHSTIAESEDLPLGTVKSRLRLALSKLRAALGPVH
ncbi:sigma-70 family RNA polymerase sigma factor [Tistrella mobilis]|uniref:sigma-70 family RNA polymerase sigma factor n=1 Tax=Tistrella mobilis TaxID=171437 RepID=UPI003555E5C3